MYEEVSREEHEKAFAEYAGSYAKAFEKKPEELHELFAALAKARLEFKPVVFDKVNPHFNSKFASLHAMQVATIEGLSNNGLTVIQMPCETETFGVRTLLCHSSGQYLENTLPMQPTKNDPQGRGSAITYACRYSYAAMLNIAGGDDDDGNEASIVMPVAEATVVQGFYDRLYALSDSDKGRKALITRFCKKFGIESLAELPAAQVEEANAAIMAKEGAK